MTDSTGEALWEMPYCIHGYSSQRVQQFSMEVDKTKCPGRHWPLQRALRTGGRDIGEGKPVSLTSERSGLAFPVLLEVFPGCSGRAR